MNLFVFASLALFATTFATECFQFTGKFASSSTKIALGDLVTITWKTLTTKSECKNLNADAEVRIELWDSDFGPDDKLFAITGTKPIKNTGSFQWNFPWDSTRLNDLAGGGFEGDPDLYFKIVSVLNTDLDGESAQFDHTDSNSYVRIVAPTAKSFATGSLISFAVITKALPARKFSVYLIGPGSKSKVTDITTTSSQTGLIRFNKGFYPTASAKTGTYYLEVETTDGKSPSKEFKMNTPDYFKITQTPNDFKLTKPSAGQKVKANTDLSITWDVTSGFQQTETLTLELWRDDTFTPDDKLLTRTGIKMFDHSYLLKIPPQLEGTNFYIKLIPAHATNLVQKSSNFEIQKADRSCEVEFPTRSDVVTTGTSTTFKYRCTGYAATEKADIYLEENVRAGDTPTKIELKKEAGVTGVVSIAHTVPGSVQQGWQWFVPIKVTADQNRQAGSYFLITDGGEQCGGGSGRKRATTAVCERTGGEALLVNPGEDFRLNKLEITSKTLSCGTGGFVLLELKQTWNYNGTAEAPITAVAKFFPVATEQKQQLILGDNVGRFGGSKSTFFKFVAKDVTMSETSVSFTAGVQYSSVYATLWLGTVSVELAAKPTGCEVEETVVETFVETTTLVEETIAEETVTLGTSEQITTVPTVAPEPETPAGPTSPSGETPATGTGAPFNSSATSLAVGTSALLVLLALFF
eukprot:CAMPEP_0168586818 /NCGR_PEP_ID=MMETSP0420-20121227/4509_1 /TAXON_ID=498008 /ORGANISM="Pessonella sp." /LENGTH=693 /DNA_ID=CAMNT_0008621979 /DNA_START=21 /DNA_END=2102 /DNA_ORIENTATION=+